MEKETLEQQTNDPHNNFERFDNSPSQNQVIENNIDYKKIGRAVDKAVLTVENRLQDAILTAIDKMARIETAVRSVTGPTTHEPISDVQNPDRRDFLRNVGNTPLMSASSGLDINTNQNRNDETSNEEDFEDDEFPALRPSYDRRAPTRHSCTMAPSKISFTCSILSLVFHWRKCCEAKIRRNVCSW